MKTPAYLVLMSLALLFDGRAETLTFDFKDSEGVNNEIKRSDFGIRPGEFLDKVSNEIDLSLSIAGAAAKER